MLHYEIFKHIANTKKAMQEHQKQVEQLNRQEQLETTDIHSQTEQSEQQEQHEYQEEHKQQSNESNQYNNESNQYSENKPYVVLLHGFGGNHRVWKHQIPVLQEKYNVLAIDLPSHYEGNMKLSEIQVTLDSVAQEILKVLNILGIKQAMFIGVSLGTIMIKYIEYKYPEYVTRAILVGAVGKVNTAISTIVNIFANIGDKLPFKAVYSTFSKVIMPLKSSKDSREIFCKCAVVLNCKEFKAWMGIFKEAFSFNKQFSLQEHKENIYISGHSDICFIKGIRQEVEKTKARFIELSNCGHICNIDQRVKFNNILREIISNRALAYSI